MKRLTAIDLFAGAGGASAGLFLAGCDVRLAVECDSESVATYKANFPTVEVLPGLIESYTPAVILRRAGIRKGELDILTACPPCQGFSTLGTRDENDERNDYVIMVGMLTEALMPQALIMENVVGLARDHRLGLLVDKLSSLGYGVAHWTVNATDFCVPQNRKRLLLIAVLGLSDDEIESPLTDYDCVATRPHPHNVREAFKLLRGKLQRTDPLARPRVLAGKVLQRVQAIPLNGGSRKDLPRHLRLRCHETLRNSAAGSVYGRMSWDQPAPTITTRCTTPACGRFVHPAEHRPISLREAAALQTFWPAFRWIGGHMSVCRQIGNAVPVRLSYLVAKHVIALIARAPEP